MAEPPGSASKNVLDSSEATVDAVVVDYHAGERLRRCVASLRAEGCGEIVVVDNSTRGATNEALAGEADVMVLESAVNGGFGAGVNLGVARARSAAVLVCNPDVELRPGALQALIARLDDDVAIVAPSLYDATGRRRPGARPLPTLATSAPWALLGLLAPGNGLARRHRQRQQARVVEGRACWVPGTCLLVRRDAFEQVGGFDEAFFLYLEEVDLCRRLGEQGWRVVVEPSAEVVHAGGVSTAQRRTRSVLAYHASLWRYLDKSTRGPARIVLPAAALAIACRCALALALTWARRGTSVLAAPVEA